MKQQLLDRAARPQADILVVDDTVANLQVLTGMLKERGYKVRPVPSGKLALQAARHVPPDLILLDINMPEMNGYEVCEQLKSDIRLAGVPVIFISALTEQLDKVKAFSLGGVDYLTKPFQMGELYARVETHLKLRWLQVELEEYSRHLEAARERIKVDLDFARKVQRGLLPLRPPRVADYEFFTHYEPAHEIGGDYLDFIPLPGERIAVIVGDVMGKGVTAALLMAKLIAETRYCMLTEPDPAAAFRRLNSLMIEPEFQSRFVTMIAAVLDPRENTVTLVNAGHPTPLIYRHAAGTIEEVVAIAQTACPLGIIECDDFPLTKVSLEPGDCMLAFTDGVTESTNEKNEQLQTEALYSALRTQSYSPQSLVEQAVRIAREFAGNRSQNDDMALVGFGRTG